MAPVRGQGGAELPPLQALPPDAEAIPLPLQDLHHGPPAVEEDGEAALLQGIPLHQGAHGASRPVAGKPEADRCRAVEHPGVGGKHQHGGIPGRRPITRQGVPSSKPRDRRTTTPRASRETPLSSPPGSRASPSGKEKCSGKPKWLYAFRDAAKAAMEEQEWLRRAREKGNYTCETFLAKQRSFGTIVLECDLDLPPETVYRAYASRWEIGIVMRYYKNACQFDDTRVQDDYSLLGSEFCDFLATVVTFRIIKAFEAARLLEKRNYGRVMAILRRAKMARMEGEGWQLFRMDPSHMEILQELGLLPKPEEPPKRKRGRPRKNPL